jgi:hypothetical protein
VRSPLGEGDTIRDVLQSCRSPTWAVVGAFGVIETGMPQVPPVRLGIWAESWGDPASQDSAPIPNQIGSACSIPVKFGPKEWQLVACKDMDKEPLPVNREIDGNRSSGNASCDFQALLVAPRALDRRGRWECESTSAVAGGMGEWRGNRFEEKR